MSAAIPWKTTLEDRICTRRIRFTDRTIRQGRERFGGTAPSRSQLQQCRNRKYENSQDLHDDRQGAGGRTAGEETKVARETGRRRVDMLSTRGDARDGAGWSARGERFLVETAQRLLSPLSEAQAGASRCPRDEVVDARSSAAGLSIGLVREWVPRQTRQPCCREDTHHPWTSTTETSASLMARALSNQPPLGGMHGSIWQTISRHA
jgi:hypothetical protein